MKTTDTLQETEKATVRNYRHGEPTAWHLVGAFFGVIFAIAGLCLGAVLGQAEYNSVGESFKKKDELRAQCVAGNDRACQIYEVDYGRR